MILRFLNVAGACALALAFAATAVPSIAEDKTPQPFIDTAQSLGVPNLVVRKQKRGGANITYLFVPKDETDDNWTRMFSVVSFYVDRSVTPDLIQSFHDGLKARKVDMKTFEVNKVTPPIAYFEYTVKNEHEVGVIFSPVEGLVTVQQYDVRGDGTYTKDDVSKIKALVGHP